MTRIALVGCGLVGGSWALVFARAGLDVTLYDPSPASIDAAMEVARTSAAALSTAGLLNGQSPAEIMSRLKPVASLAEAVSSARSAAPVASARQAHPIYSRAR